MKYNTIYAFGENNESVIRSRQVPVSRGLISIVFSVLNSGPNNYYGIDRILIWTGSGMYRLHCTTICMFLALVVQVPQLHPYLQANQRDAVCTPAIFDISRGAGEGGWVLKVFF